VNRDDILSQLQSQLDAVNAAIAALRSRHGRKKRRLSAEARHRISQAQKKRWAAKKK
jgi:hypothetical protein